MAHSKFSIALLAFLPVMLLGQNNAAPLKNWTTPLYWQPNEAERRVAGQVVPQIQFSTNAVSNTALIFIAITPCRLVDTRGGAFNGMSPFSGPSIAAGATATFPVQSTTEASANTAPAPCGVIPTIAQAYSFNLTVIPHASGAVDYITMWPANGTQPYVSTLDDPQGIIASNAAIVPAGTPTGGVSVFNFGPSATDVIIDMNGYFAAPTDAIWNTAIGAGSLANNTTGTYNTASGSNALLLNTTGGSNTANGASALQQNTTGSDNTAIGFEALVSNTTGNFNTASGSAALALNTIGYDNTASGYGALQSNVSGDDNTATGTDALYANTTGNLNTAVGSHALFSNTTGYDNAAVGEQSLQYNTTGYANMASGYAALERNTTGALNTASGYLALFGNTTGNDNTATGVQAMQANTTGFGNTAIGFFALQLNTTGGNNIAIGYDAAVSVANGNSNNIEIGSLGHVEDGASANSGAIRIGDSTVQTSFIVAGVRGITTGQSNAVPVVIDSTGQMGTVNSSRRFKEDIQDMGDASSGLLQLRPVTFRYKKPFSDGSKPIEYGLIAEEVEEIYPDLVAHSADGQVETVKYQVLDSMLLNEVKKQAEQIRQQAEQIRQQAEQIRLIETQGKEIQIQSALIRALENRLAAMETQR